jgi:hypothetical protein
MQRCSRAFARGRNAHGGGGGGGGGGKSNIIVERE